jgi:hypothetical protein
MTIKETAILFSGPMVRANLNREKTQTRRICKLDDNGRLRKGKKCWHLEDPEAVKACPYGQAGDRLWVRETHRYWWPEWPSPGYLPCRVRYRADDAVVALPIDWEEGPQFLTPEDAGLDKEPIKWRPSIFTPRWASRITLEITDVRLQQLQDISGPDCWAEGIAYAGWDLERYGSTVECYRDLWESIHGPRSWDPNQLVWRISYCLITP